MLKLTVEQALTVYPLSEGNLVAGSMGCHGIVRSVIFIEAPEYISHAKEGDLLLMTKTMAEASAADGGQLVRMLHEKGCAGLCLKLEGKRSLWTDMLMDEAERISFPMIELPSKMAFSDVIGGLFKVDMQHDLQLLQTIVDKQKRLMRYVFRQELLHQKFSSLSTILNMSFAVINLHGGMVFNNTTTSDQKIIEQWPWRNRDRWVIIQGQTFCRITLALGEERLGNILFLTGDFLSKLEGSLLNQVAEMISYQLEPLKQGQYALSSPADMNALFKRYLQGELSSDDLVDEARSAGISLCKGDYYAVLVSSTDIEAIGIVHELMNHPELRKLSIGRFETEAGHLLIVPVNKVNRIDDLTEIAKDSLERQRQVGNASPVRITVSYKKGSPAELKEAYTECIDVVRMANGLGKEEQVISFMQLEFAFMFEGVARERMVHYSRMVFKKLDEDESEVGKELMRTLEVYVEQDGQINETAKLLFIHRNTVVYRLEKISELLEIDFKRTADLLRLKLAFVIRRILQVTKYKRELDDPE